MPACARKEIVLEGQVAIYHVWSRCVRQAFLCGKKSAAGGDRRAWIHAYLKRLSGLFAVNASFHSEMENHIHLEVRTCPDVVETWSDEEVVRRWKVISKLIHSKDSQTVKEVTEKEIEKELKKPGRVAELRKRLSSLSHFMKAFNEHISRRANREDGTKGAFFDGRFGCRRIENEAGVLACGVYIDLNPIRAGEACTPETSLYTSAYDRICGHRQRQEAAGRTLSFGTTSPESPDGWLSELTLDERADAWKGAHASTSGRRASDKGLLPISLEDYLALLDWTGRQIVAGKTGAIPRNLAPILERIGIRQSDKWLELASGFHTMFGHVVGTGQQVADAAARAGRRCYGGRAACEAFFG